MGIPKAEAGETYPGTIEASAFNAFNYDYQAYQKQLYGDSNRLFADDMQIKVVEIGSQGEFSHRPYDGNDKLISNVDRQEFTIESSEALGKYLQVLEKDNRS